MGSGASSRPQPVSVLPRMFFSILSCPQNNVSPNNARIAYIPDTSRAELDPADFVVGQRWMTLSIPSNKLLGTAAIIYGKDNNDSLRVR